MLRGERQHTVRSREAITHLLSLHFNLCLSSASSVLCSQSSFHLRLVQVDGSIQVLTQQLDGDLRVQQIVSVNQAASLMEGIIQMTHTIRLECGVVPRGWQCCGRLCNLTREAFQPVPSWDD